MAAAQQHTKGFSGRRKSGIAWRKPSSRAWSPAGETAGGSDSWAQRPSQQWRQIDLETRRLEEMPHSIAYRHPQTLQQKVAGWETGRIKEKTKPSRSVTFLALGHVASAPRSRSCKTCSKTPGTCCRSCPAVGPAHGPAGIHSTSRDPPPFLHLGKRRGTESTELDSLCPQDAAGVVLFTEPASQKLHQFWRLHGKGEGKCAATQDLFFLFHPKRHLKLQTDRQILFLVVNWMQSIHLATRTAVMKQRWSHFSECTFSWEKY